MKKDQVLKDAKFKLFSFVMTREEKKMLHELATLEGLDMTKWLRQKIRQSYAQKAA